VRLLTGPVLAVALIVVPLASAAPFGRPAEIPVARAPVAVAMLDATQDGLADVVVGNAAGAGAPLTLLRGRGTGAFDRPVDFGSGPAPRALAVGDFDGDGGDDLAVAGANLVAVYMQVDGALVKRVEVSLPAPGARALLATDLDLDGNLDLVASMSNRAQVTVFQGAGDGNFVAGIEYPTRDAPAALFAADVDGDGLPDLVTGGSSGVSVLPGNGDGTLGRPAAVTDTPGITALTGEDFDSDGDIDLADARTPNAVDVLLNDGEGGFATSAHTVGGSPVAIATAYLDSDSSLDLVTANSGTNDVSVLPGAEDGTFGQQVRFPVGKGPASLTVGDLNDDGASDLVVSDQLSKAVTVMLNGVDAPVPVACRVPVLTRKTLASARRLVAAAHCKVGTVRRKYSARYKKGRVIAVTPLPGTVRPVDTAVTLLLSRGRRPKG